MHYGQSELSTRHPNRLAGSASRSEHTPGTRMPRECPPASRSERAAAGTRVGVEGNIFLETAILEVEGSTHFLYRPYSSLRWKIYPHVFDPVLDF